MIRKTISKIKASLVAYQNYDDTSLPKAVKSKLSKYTLIGVCIINLGLIVSVTQGKGFEILFAFLFPLTLGLALILMGVGLKHNIISKGFEVKTGKCINHHQITFNRVGRVDKMIVETNEEILEIPIAKLNAVVPIGSYLRIYIVNGTVKYTVEGINHYGNILAYEMIPEDMAN